MRVIINWSQLHTPDGWILNEIDPKFEYESCYNNAI